MFINWSAKWQRRDESHAELCGAVEKSTNGSDFAGNLGTAGRVARFLVGGLDHAGYASFAAVRLVASAALFIAWSAALAAPPPGADLNSPEAKWYRGLAQPKTGYGCCSIADCRPVPFQSQEGHYVAYIARGKFPNGDDAWHDVPDSVVIRDQPNPTGEGRRLLVCQPGPVLVLPSMT